MTEQGPQNVAYVLESHNHSLLGATHHPASKLCSKEPSLLVPNDNLRHVWRLTVGGTIYNKGQTHTVFWMEDAHTVVTENAWSMSPLPTPQQIWQKHRTGMLAKNQQECMSVNQWFKTCANLYYKTHAETHTHTNAFAHMRMHRHGQASTDNHI